jgi:hypothetical protein
MLEQVDRQASGGYELFAAATRELHEELNVHPDEISEMVIVGLVRDMTILQPELLFEAGVTLSRGQLQERFRSAVERGEHTGIEFVRAERVALGPFLERARPVTPVAKAAMVLFGRSRWGDAWYQRTCRQLLGGLPPAAIPGARRDTN